MDFANNFHALRKKAGFSQEDIADKLHISRQAVSKWENGQSMPDIDTCVKLCEVLNISPNQLLLGQEVGNQHSQESVKNQSKFFHLILPIFLMLVLVCGTTMLLCNLYNGIIFEPAIHIVALIMIFASLISFFAVIISNMRAKNASKKR